MRHSKKNAIIVLLVFMMQMVFIGCATTPPDREARDASEPSRPETAITSINTMDTADGTQVTIRANGPLTFSSLKQPDPLAVVLYFPQTTVQALPAEQAVDSDQIVRLLAREGVNNSGTARIEIQLAHDVIYKAEQLGNDILLSLTAVGQHPGRQTTAAAGYQTDDMPQAASSAEPSTSEAAQSEENQTTGAALSPTAIENTSNNQPRTQVATSGAPAWVNKIDFMSEAEGKSTLVVGTTQAVDFRLEKQDPRKIQLRLLNTRIPSYRQRPLITTRFNSAVDRIVPFQPTKQAETIISIELREAVPYFTEQAGNQLLVHFEPSSVPPKPMEQAQLPDWKQVMTAGQPVGQPAMAATEPSYQGAAADSELMPAQKVSELNDAALEEMLMQEDRDLRAILSPRRKHYTGEKIALDFYETDIKNVFRILREVSGKNFAIDKDVTGKVTMTLDKPVPWDQVLDLVLRMNQLGMSQEGDIVRIATLETLRQEDDLRQAKLAAMRKAREEAKALEPMITRYYPVSYSNAMNDIKPHIEKILTASRGSVTVDEKNNQVIVTDTAEKLRQAEIIIRRIDKVTAQVIIEARVVEVTSTFSKELGIDWSMSYGPGIISGSGVNTTTDLAMNLPSASTSSIGINFSRLSGVPFVLNARLNALETTGEGRILSSPKILTLDNKKAKIKQGLEVGYLERDSAGGSSVKFKPVDLLLEVTPHVTPDNRISLAIYITKNDISDFFAGVPSVATNEAQTELLINDGDTVVIGGIIKRTENKASSGFPLLSKIPILGWAFKNEDDSSANNELLIFITPRIVQLEQAAAPSTLQ